MLIMFISLLLSIAAGNVLNGAEERREKVNESTVIKMNGNGVAVEVDKDLSDVCSSRSTILLGKDTSLASFDFILSRETGLTRPVTTLADMKQLSTEILQFEQTRDRNRGESSEQSEVETTNLTDLSILFESDIPEGVEIASTVFDEYAKREGLTTEFEPGWLKRIFCCRSSDKNQFKSISNRQHKEWAKKILIFSGQPTGQTETRETEYLDFDEVMESAVENSGDDLAEKVKILENQLSSEKLLTKAEKLLAGLNEDMRNFIRKKQKTKDRNDKLKAITYALLFIGSAFVAGVYSICPS